MPYPQHGRAKPSRSRILTLANMALITGLVTAGQPTYPGTPGQFRIVGDAGISAQQAFLGTPDKVYVLDKTENNPVQVGGHPAWAVEYDVNHDTYRTMDVVSNTFCAAGNVLGNGTWINVGGNAAVTWGGNNANAPNTGPYFDANGGKAIRFLNPCEDESCNWDDNQANYMTTARWYPTLETLSDGSIIIIGGDTAGGYVNAAAQNNPTYEFYPSQGNPVGLNILVDTLPANLFSLTWLLPSDRLFIQTNWAAEIFDYKNSVEHPIGNIPHSVRTYPGSGATAMLPLTPANNWTATILFCGGVNLQPDRWVTNWDIAQNPTDATCVKITPDVSTTWIDEGEKLPDGRSMGSFIILPDGTLFLTNGVNTGTAGYGNDSWAVGTHSYGDHPLYNPLVYDPSKPLGSRMNATGLGNLNTERMYHSSALLLPDGSVWISGSNPNPDYISPNSGAKYPTRTSVERFFPLYYDETRPEPQNLPKQLGYGGPWWNISLTADDLLGSEDNLPLTSVVIIRPGFSTHAMNMGQRYVQLNSTYVYHIDGSATLTVQQLPPNPAVLAPGPALLFVVVNGIPSVGQQIMVGNGMLGNQTINAVTDLPSSYVETPAPNTATAQKNKAVSNTQINFTWLSMLVACSLAMTGLY